MLKVPFWTNCNNSKSAISFVIAICFLHNWASNTQSHECWMNQNHFAYISPGKIQLLEMFGLVGPWFCIVILNLGQPGLVRWILLWIMPQVQYRLFDLLTCSLARYHCTMDAPPTHDIITAVTVNSTTRNNITCISELRFIISILYLFIYLFIHILNSVAICR